MKFSAHKLLAFRSFLFLKEIALWSVIPFLYVKKMSLRHKVLLKVSLNLPPLHKIYFSLLSPLWIVDEIDIRFNFSKLTEMTILSSILLGNGCDL